MNYDRPKLLLVQRDPQTSALIAFRLSLLGFEITAVFHETEVPTYSEPESVPDLALIDLRSGDGTNLELIKRLRSFAQTQEVPVIACSSDSSPEAVRSAFLAGANDYLLLPFDPVIMEQKIEKLLSPVSEGIA